MKKLKLVADMAADLFHVGHINLLRGAKTYFKNEDVHLTVALHTDKQILSYKKRLPVMNFDCRREVLISCIYVDNVIEAPDDFDESFINNFDYLVHGDDLLQWDKALFDRFYKVVYAQNKLIVIPYTKGISTTELRQAAVAAAK